MTDPQSSEPDPGSPLAAASGSGFDLADVVERLTRRRPEVFDRYHFRGKLGRGASGSVLDVWDEDFKRHLAMKVLHPRHEQPPESGSDEALRSLGRFLEEAQVTGQLDHPGVLPVHELGLDPDGRFYFTMKRVRGETLQRVFERARQGDERWTLARALDALLKVCDALAYAHDKGVVHRDLKPANIMVGRFGEVYVMDWGLARVLDREETRDIRPRLPEGPPESEDVRTDRKGSGSSESPLFTMDGDIIGTPSYMAPEQAAGELARIGPRSDVYALGAMIYHLVTGCVPYVPRGARVKPIDVVYRVLEGPPKPLQELAGELPGELIAICEKAMQRDPQARYADMNELGDDLRAYLEGRVVRAYRTGAWIELVKWTARNRTMAAVLGLLLVVALSAGFVIAAQERRKTEIALDGERRTQRLLDERSAAAYLIEADELWPVHPDQAPRMERWLEGARALVARTADARAELAEVAALGRPAAPGADVEPEGVPERVAERLRHLRYLHDGMQGFEEQFSRELEELEPSEYTDELQRSIAIFDLEIPDLRRRIDALERELVAARRPRFDDDEFARRYDRLAAFVHDLDALADAKVGAIARVAERARLATSLARLTLDDQRGAWARASASIRDREACPLYEGLELREQLGLVPLGRDAESGLWEFLHLLSGEHPRVGASGAYEIAPETGIVLVLIPGGTTWMGAEPTGRHADPAAGRSEAPVHAVELDPYFLSKYELTQGQWIRLTGDNPSTYFAGLDFRGDPRVSRTHPVEHVSWVECERALARWGLEIPTEAQWERAARAGTTTPYWTGASFEGLIGMVNGADLSLLEREFRPQEALHHDDGYSLHAPVDVFPANPFGLHSILGNVWEWTRDWARPAYEFRELAPGDGEHLVDFGREKTCRGGSFMSERSDLRVSNRAPVKKEGVDDEIGVRPARRLDP